jgi:uncharacterized protein (DUF1810 family)
MQATSSFALSRFVLAQSGTYDIALAELLGGRKRTHWMWFIFPQLVGLGLSVMAERYGITGLAETRAYLHHPLLGGRLREATAAVLTHRDRSARTIFGVPDDLKFCSSMTLFALAEGDGSIFGEALDAFFSRKPDPGTMRLLDLA